MIRPERTRRFVFSHPGAEGKISNDPVSDPGRGELLIRVAAAALNFADLLALKGQYQETTEWPHVPGMEFAGNVIAAGDTSQQNLVGQKVACFPGRGGLSDYAISPFEKTVLLGSDAPLVEAAAIPIAYGTSHLALTRCARLTAGQTLVVLGASGGVGLTAVEIGKLLGARVIGCARGKEKCAVAQKAGADITLDTDETTDLRSALRDMGGVDVVYDAVGGDQGLAAFKSLRPGGHFLIIGFASGEPPRLPLNHALVKNITLSGFYWGGLMDIDATAVRDSLVEVYQWHREGRVRPHISRRLPLEQAQEGLDLLATRKATGKVVIVP